MILAKWSTQYELVPSHSYRNVRRCQLRHTDSGPRHDRRRRHRDVAGTPPSSPTRPGGIHSYMDPYLYYICSCCAGGGGVGAAAGASPKASIRVESFAIVPTTQHDSAE